MHTTGVRLVVGYDGTDFIGWQRQPRQRSVCEELEAAIRQIDPDASDVLGCSRTDSGVHALGQVASFDAVRQIPDIGWIRGLNGKLPRDVAVQSAEPCPVGYNPRYDALGKTYRYLLHVGAERDPLWRHTSWHIGPQHARPREMGRGPVLSLDPMEEAAARFVGEHDFRAFRAAADPRPDSVRTIREMKLVRGYGGVPDLVAIEVRGTAFLQHMVRILVGTLIDVGRERLTPADIPRLLTPTSRREDTGQTAPPHGLTLVSIELGRMALDPRP